MKGIAIWFVLVALLVVALLIGAGGRLPSASFISHAIEFSSFAALQGSGRCQSPPPAVGIYNDENRELQSYTGTVTVTAVDSSINSMHIGRTEAIGVQYQQSNSCEIYNAPCDKPRRVDAFTGSRGISIDGQCKWLYSVSYKDAVPVAPSLSAEPLPFVEPSLSAEPSLPGGTSPSVGTSRPEPGILDKISFYINDLIEWLRSLFK